MVYDRVLSRACLWLAGLDNPYLRLVCYSWSSSLRRLPETTTSKTSSKTSLEKRKTWSRTHWQECLWIWLWRVCSSKSWCLHLSEETGLIESIEGKQGKPWLKPSFQQTLKSLDVQLSILSRLKDTLSNLPFECYDHSRLPASVIETSLTPWSLLY